MYSDPLLKTKFTGTGSDDNHNRLLNVSPITWCERRTTRGISLTDPSRSIGILNLRRGTVDSLVPKTTIGLNLYGLHGTTFFRTCTTLRTTFGPRLGGPGMWSRTEDGCETPLAVSIIRPRSLSGRNINLLSPNCFILEYDPCTFGRRGRGDRVLMGRVMGALRGGGPWLGVRSTEGP